MAFKPELPTAIVRYPESPTEPILVGFEGVEIEAAIASREVLKTFEGLDEYQERGVYVLMGDASTAMYRRAARPGEAGTKKLDARLRQHLAYGEEQATLTLFGWDTAALFRRLTRPFGREETGVLESLLHAGLDACRFVERVGNRSNYRASDDNVQTDLENRVFPALLVGLRLAGLDLRTEADIAAQENARARHRPLEGTEKSEARS